MYMKKRFTRLSLMLASAGLTLLGFGGCETSKKVQQRHNDKTELQRLLQEEKRMKEAMKADSVQKAYEDSIRMARAGKIKVVYGGPSMMGRRPLNDSTDVQPDK